MLAVKEIYGLIFAVWCITAFPASRSRYGDLETCVGEITENAKSLLKFYEEHAGISAAQLWQDGRGKIILTKFPKLPSCPLSENLNDPEIRGVFKGFEDHFNKIRSGLTLSQLSITKRNISLSIEMLKYCSTESISTTSLPDTKFEGLKFIDIKDGLYYVFEHYKNCAEKIRELNFGGRNYLLAATGKI